MSRVSKSAPVSPLRLLRPEELAQMPVWPKPLTDQLQKVRQESPAAGRQRRGRYHKRKRQPDPTDVRFSSGSQLSSDNSPLTPPPGKRQYRRRWYTERQQTLDKWVVPLNNRLPDPPAATTAAAAVPPADVTTVAVDAESADIPDADAGVTDTVPPDNVVALITDQQQQDHDVYVLVADDVFDDGTSGTPAGSVVIGECDAGDDVSHSLSLIALANATSPYFDAAPVPLPSEGQLQYLFNDMVNFNMGRAAAAAQRKKECVQKVITDYFTVQKRTTVLTPKAATSAETDAAVASIVALD